MEALLGHVQTSPIAEGIWSAWCVTISKERAGFFHVGTHERVS